MASMHQTVKQLSEMGVERFWNRDRWMRIAVILWAVFAVAAGVKAFTQPNRHAVYPVFSEGARRWSNQEPLYEGSFYYSPAFAVALTPLAKLPDAYGGVIWGTFSLAFLFASLLVFYREVVARVRPDAHEGVFLALSLAATIHGSWSGQSNALVLAVILLGAVQVLRQHWWAAALLMSVAVHIKIWPIVIAFLLAFRWFKPLIPRLVVALPLVGLIPFLTRPPGQVLLCYQQWYACLVARMIEGGRWPGYRDAWTIWENIAPPVPPRIYTALIIVSALLTAAWCLRQARRPVTAQGYVLAVVAMWACWQLLFGPGSERLTYGIVAPAVSWAMCESFMSRRYRSLALLAWLFTGLLGTGEVESLIRKILPIAPILMPLGPIFMVLWLILNERCLPTEVSGCPSADSAASVKG